MIRHSILIFFFSHASNTSKIFLLCSASIITRRVAAWILENEHKASTKPRILAEFCRGRRTRQRLKGRDASEYRAASPKSADSGARSRIQCQAVAAAGKWGIQAALEDGEIGRGACRFAGIKTACRFRDDIQSNLENPLRRNLSGNSVPTYSVSLALTLLIQRMRDLLSEYFNSPSWKVSTARSSENG